MDIFHAKSQVEGGNEETMPRGKYLGRLGMVTAERRVR